MTRNDLPDDLKKEYDIIANAMIKEMEEKVPRPNQTLDDKPNIIRKQIADKYIPSLEEILRKGASLKRKA